MHERYMDGSVMRACYLVILAILLAVLIASVSHSGTRRYRAYWSVVGSSDGSVTRVSVPPTPESGSCALPAELPCEL